LLINQQSRARRQPPFPSIAIKFFIFSNFKFLANAGYG
jgi:hypothetical protein